MAKVKVIISTVRFGEDQYKHFGDEYELPELEAKEKAEQGLIEILSLDEPETKEFKQKVKSK